jgi:hypothetical protein
VGRDHNHRSGRVQGGPGRGGNLDVRRAMNDRDTGAEVVYTENLVRIDLVTKSLNIAGES